MACNRKSAYGGPAEEKEVVISLDKRLLYGVGLIVAFAIAVGGGYMATRQSEPTTAQAPAANFQIDAVTASEGVVQIQGTLDEAEQILDIERIAAAVPGVKKVDLRY